MQSVEKKKKKKRVKEIISEDSVLVGKRVLIFLKKMWEANIEMHECWQKKDFCVEGGCFGGATGAMLYQKRRQAKWSQFVIMYCYAYDLVRMY